MNSNKEYFIKSIRQLLFSEVGHLATTDLSRHRIREIKRIISKTLRAEVVRLRLDPPEGGWKPYIKELVSKSIDDYVFKLRNKGIITEDSKKEQ